jgi:hypothetical protein
VVKHLEINETCGRVEPVELGVVVYVVVVAAGDVLLHTMGSRRV